MFRVCFPRAPSVSSEGMSEPSKSTPSTFSEGTWSPNRSRHDVEQVRGMLSITTRIDIWTRTWTSTKGDRDRYQPPVLPDMTGL